LALGKTWALDLTIQEIEETSVEKSLIGTKILAVQAAGRTYYFGVGAAPWLVEKIEQLRERQQQDQDRTAAQSPVADT